MALGTITLHSEILRDFTAGSLAGFSCKVIDYPLDTVKVLLQTQPAATAEKPAVYNGAWDCLSQTVRANGFGSLYRGISSPLVGSVAENAVLFLSYNRIKRLLGERPEGPDLDIWRLSLAGACAGGVASFVVTPVELVKCRLQVQNAAGRSGFTAFRGPLHVISHAIKQEGLFRGLFRGHVSTLCREIPGNFVYYGTYELTCKAMIPPGGRKADLGPSAHLLGGMLSGMGYWTAFYPADVVKSLMQTRLQFAHSSFLETARTIVAHEGWAGLYRGYGVTVVRAAPSHAILFAVYEQCMKVL